MLSSGPLSCCEMPSLKSFKLMLRKAPDRLAAVGCLPVMPPHTACYTTTRRKTSGYLRLISEHHPKHRKKSVKIVYRSYKIPVFSSEYMLYNETNWAFDSGVFLNWVR